MRAPKPPLSVADIVALVRQRHPDALACVECGRLLATQRSSYAKSNLNGALAYVCAECRQDAAEAASRSASISESISRSRALAAARVLHPPLTIINKGRVCACTDTVTCAFCLIERTAALEARERHEMAGQGIDSGPPSKRSVSSLRGGRLEGGFRDGRTPRIISRPDGPKGHATCAERARAYREQERLRTADTQLTALSVQGGRMPVEVLHV
jgi:hypothetical protein